MFIARNWYNFLLFKMKYVTDGGCLFDHWHVLSLYYPDTWMNLSSCMNELVCE